MRIRNGSVKRKGAMVAATGLALIALPMMAEAQINVTHHPNANGSTNTFSNAPAGTCPLGNWDCVNDQTGNGAFGAAEVDDDAGSYLEDGNGGSGREMFALGNGQIPATAVVTAIDIIAMVGAGTGPAKSASLSYQRVGWEAIQDSAPIAISNNACCGQQINWNLTGLTWTAAMVDALEIGIVHAGGGVIDVSQIYVMVTYNPINITSRETIDSDADGQIDHIKITADQALNDNFTDLTMTVSGYTVTGYVTEIGAGGNNDNVFYVQLTERGSPDTGVRPTVLVTANTLLTDFGGSSAIASDPAPDSKITFRSRRDGNDEIYVMDADGSNPTRLTNDAAADSGPVWSPDGSKIAFDSDRDGNNEIYVMDADGSNQTRLTNNAAADVGPSWSPDGSQIAFQSDRDGNNEIYVMDADGSNQTRLTNNAAGDLWPSWSPDGSKIAFQTGRDGDNEIYVMDADGSNPFNLTNNAASDRAPAWSPDGSKIAFISARDGDNEIYVMNADGTNQTRLTTNAANDLAPAWSPDGSQIAFRTDRDGNYEIYVMNADGSSPTNLTNNAAGEAAPSWWQDPSTLAIDSAPPVLLSAPSPNANGTLVFQVGGHVVDFVFSEILGGVATEAELEAALSFAAGATDGDNLPSISGGVNPFTLATTTTLNNTIRVTFNVGNTANTDLLLVGTYTAQVTDGTNITDLAGNPAATAPAAVPITGTGGPTAPVIAARETIDNDADGQIDHIKITTDQALNDNFGDLTVTVSGYTVTGTITEIGAGGVNDHVFYVQLTESGTPDTGVRPTVLVTANTLLTDFGGSNPVGPDPSPDSKIVFVSDRDGNSEIYVMDADGSNQTRLTNNVATDWGPTWSPDGSRITFGSFRDGNSEIYVMDADGSNQTRLTNNAAADWEPTWSSDGGKIAFQSSRDGNSEIYIMDADGTNPIRLTNNAAADSVAAWSPDGSKIAFMSDRDGNYEIYVMDADGSNQTRLTNNSAVDSVPAWSPDSSKITFDSDRDGNYEIYVMNADGSNPINLSSGPANDRGPAWSPDGSKIVFLSFRDGNNEIYVMDADGSNPINLSNGPADDGWPNWWQDPSTLATDSAPPVLLSAPSPNANGTLVFLVGGHLVDFVFSETLSGVASEAGLESALTFAAGATDGDNLPTISGGVSPFTLAANTTLNNTIRVTFNSGNTANSDLLLVGTHTAEVSNGTNITDLAGNPATTAPAAVLITGTGGPTAPVIAARETIDNDSDGQIDHIKITTDQALNDNFGDLTVTVSGYTVTGAITEIGAGGVNDNVFYVQLTESGTPDTGVRPTVQVTANTLLNEFGGSNSLVPDPPPESKIAFQTNRDGGSYEIYIMDDDGTNPTRLTNNAATDEYPAWSPDGTQIAFGSNRDGNSEIYVMDADGSNQTRLTNNAAYDNAAAWSPDGSQIAFQTNRDGNTEIYIMDADGSNPTRLTNAPGFDTFPAWSPDGTQIAFRSSRDGNNEIYVMDADGSNPTNLTNNGADDDFPAWSPDGNQIAFHSNRDGNIEIYVMDADGSNPTRLTTDAASDRVPWWSPDGSQIVFTSVRDGNWEVYNMDADGSNQTNLSNDPDTDYARTWWGNPFMATDSAPPVLLSAPSANANGTLVFLVGGHLVDFVFSETLSGVATEAELESALNFAAGATDGDNLPSISGGVNPFTLATTTTSNDTIRVTFNAGNTANTDLLLVGTHTAQVTIGTNITDLAGNPAATAGAAVPITGTGGPIAPAIAARETIDSDADGQIDHIKITTDQPLNDNFGDLTITVPGYTVTGTITEIGAGGANDHVFYVQLTESGTPDTGVRPTVLVTANTLLTEFGGSNSLVPDPAPDSKIAFRSDRDGNAEIYVMDADGSNQTNLTNNAAGDEWPSWSPDGTQIAFDSIRDGNFEIYVMDADGSNQTRLTNNAASDDRPSWSPDGTKIAFRSDRDGNYEIYVMDTDGSNQTRLTNNAASDDRPSWSPDGTLIAFYTDRDGNNEIYVMDADGSNPVNLTNNAASDLAPAWSPDGSKIAFQSGRDGNAEIFVMDADGSNPINLTNNAAVDSAPAWSGDGSQIAFRSSRDGNQEIYAMDADGTNPVNLTNDAGADWAPAWWQDVSTLATDSAPPLLLAAPSNQLNGTNVFQLVGEQVDFIFSEMLSGLPTEGQLEAAWSFANGATDGDNLPSIGGGVNPFTLATSTILNNTIRVSFNAGNTANADLLLVGTHTVQVTDGTNITDLAGNAASTAAVAVPITGTDVTSAVAEISPNDVATGSGASSFAYDIAVTFGAGLAGVDRVTVAIPRNFGAPAPVVTDVLVNGSSVGYTDNTSGRGISVDLTVKVTTAANIRVLFDARAPICEDAAGQTFLSTVDDTATGTPAQATTEGDADGDGGDANSWTVTTTGADAAQCFTKMYWADDGATMIQRANLDGTSVEDLVTGLGGPGGIDVDHAAGKMYWTDRVNQRIQRANLDGTGVEDLVTTGLTAPRGIALDVAAGKMYWVDSGAGRVQWADLDGQNVADRVTGLTDPRGIALDLTPGSEKIYWTDSTANRIQRSNLDGTGVENLVTSGVSEPWGIALDVSEGKMVWAESAGSKLQRANLDGTGVEELTAPGAFVRGVALDYQRGRMYYTVQNPSVWSADLDGSDTSTPVAGLTDPRGVELGFGAAVTAVRLTAFAAVALDGAVELVWETGSEVDNLGFHVYRSVSAEGPYERVTEHVIPGLGSSPAGARYRYQDTGLINGVTYHYKLEDIETTGATEIHGPVSATPQPGLTDPSTDAEETGGGSSRITYGDPSQNEIRVLEQDANHVVVELLTGGFFATPQEDGSVAIEIPGFNDFGEPGAPQIPTKRTWLEAIAGLKVNLVSVEAQEVDSVALRPAAAEATEIVSTRRGMVRTARRSRRPKTAVFQNGKNLYPTEVARIVGVGFQGEVKKAEVEMSPLRWDGARGQLLLARRLVVHITFAGREPSEVSTIGRRGRRYRGGGAQRRGVVARLATTEEGLYGVSFEELFGRRRRGVRTDSLRLSRLGESVAFHIEPLGRPFQPGSVLYFSSEGASANPYGHEAVYELEVGASGEAMELVSAQPSGFAIDFYRHRAEREENRMYLGTLVDAPDLWLWEFVLSPATKSYSFSVGSLSDVSEPSHLELWMMGASDFPASPDHHVRVYVNGNLVDEASWDGKKPHTVEAEILPDVLQEGENLLEIENVGDTEAAYSMVALERFAVGYPREPVAEGGKLEGVWTESGVASVSGLGAGAMVLDVTERPPQWLTGVETSASGEVRFRAEAGARYLAVSREAVLRPDVRRFRASGLKSTRHQADYLLIGPREYLLETEPLLELRKGQGLTVKAVAIEDITSEFGFGEARPEAVRDFLSYAYHHWTKPSLRYVVLFGDASYDYKDYLGTGVSNQVPSPAVKTRFMWTASDPAYASVNGDDLLPDISIGRLPAASLEEARAMVTKIVAYETGEVNRGPAVLVADNPDEAGNFEADMDEIAGDLPEVAAVKKIYLGQMGATAARDAVLAAFDEGMSLMSYVGHGGIHLWADENLLDIWQVEGLAQQSKQPILLTMNCLNGYFHFPYFNSLAEELLKAEDKGAIAAFAPSGLSLNDAAHLYHQALIAELFSGNHERLGDAVLAAQEVYAETGAYSELLSIYHLFGDPALRLR